MFQLSLCQMKVGYNKQKNLEKAAQMVKQSVEKFKSNVVALPEFFNCPISAEYAAKFAETENNSESIKALSEIAKNNNVYLVGGSMPIKDGDKYYNRTYCFDKKGNIKAKHDKVHLFDIDIPGKMTYKESQNIIPGNKFTVFETEFCNIGIGICYDIRFPEYAQLLKQKYKVDMLIYPAAFNTVTGPMHWELLHRSRALDNNVFVGMCSPTRNVEDRLGYQSYGFSSITDPFGKVIAVTGIEEDIVSSQIDLKLVKDITEQIPTFKQKRNDMYELNIKH